MIDKHICDYGCGQEATHYFKTAKKWCCSKSFLKCPSVKKKRSEIMLKVNEGSKADIMRKAIADGSGKCYLCGAPAKHIVFSSKLCCMDRITKCPKHKEVLRASMKDKYTPERIEAMRQTMLEVQNRPEVKEKKRKTMLKLHNEDCIPCREFQQKFKKAHKKRRLKNG
jgi:hypothetical protein